MLPPEPWLFLIELKVKNYDNWQPCLNNQHFSLQSVIKNSTIYTDIDYIYTHICISWKKTIANNWTRVESHDFPDCRSECGALQRGSKNEPFNCGMCGTVGKTWGNPTGKTNGKDTGKNRWAVVGWRWPFLRWFEHVLTVLF